MLNQYPIPNRTTYTRAVLVALLLTACANQALAQDFIRGVDISHLDRLEQHGAVFRDAGVPGDAMLILRDHGANWVRLRLWHSPSDGYNGLDRTVEMGKRIHAAGMHFLLDIHYSDTWADPGKQTKPFAWRNASFEVLKDSVRSYTERVISRLRDAGALPHMVQIGNEITSGMLWPDGQVEGSNETQWNKLAELLTEGIHGVRSAGGDSIEIMIHIHSGGSVSTSSWFFENLTRQGVDYDIIGLSFYPWWHGSLNDLKNNLTMLSSRYDKDIVVVETAYPFTLGWGDNENNIVGEERHLHAGYPASVPGQRDFLEDLFQVVHEASRGRGVMYWEPAHIPVQGFGSPWENLALFSFQGNLLASADAFRTASVLATRDDRLPGNGASRTEAYPNPFRSTLRIKYELERTSRVELRLYDLLGRCILANAAGARVTGTHEFLVETSHLAAGTYLYELMVDGERADAGLVVRASPP